MTQYPLTPYFNLIQADASTTPRRETEREIFERIARTMREDQREAVHGIYFYLGAA